MSAVNAANNPKRHAMPLSSARGFTLIEILVAFVIFAVLGVAVLRLFNASLDNAQSADVWSRAALVAQSQIARVTAEAPLIEGVTQGDDQEIHWTIEVTPDTREDVTPKATALSSAELKHPLKLYKILAKVDFNNAWGIKKTVTMVTYHTVADQT
ncbi:MAG: type II secretion system GspH family protein [Burkholderiales bacterium]|jgi:type II secretion system protein I|nr:type II secretion system GspH family protein [Burkholderiales bacterium]